MSRKGSQVGSSSNSGPVATTSTGEKIQLTGSHQLSGEIGKKYKLLVQILTSDPRYAKALAEVIPGARHERLSEALTNISYEIGASLSIIKALIGLEFVRKKHQPTTILRSNSIVSKMISRYCKHVGTEYLEKCIGPLVRETNDMKEPLEVNAEKMKGDNIEERVQENLKKATEICQRFVDRITSQVMIDEMPRQLRAICHFLVFSGEQNALELDKYVLPLIAGFIMLRYVNTAITLPNNYGLMQKPPAGVGRTNLTLIAKVLQKLANGETFQTEAPDLMPFNVFIQKNQATWVNYLRDLPKDTQEIDGREPFGDLQKTISYEDIHYKTFSMEDLIFIHQMIYEYGYDLIVSLQTEVIMTIEKRPVSIVSHNTDFLALVQDLGPPPEKENKLGAILDSGKDKKDEKKTRTSIFGQKKDKEQANKEPAKGEKKVKDNMKGKTFDQIQDTILEKSMDTLMKNISQFDLSELEQARFLYIGKPTKTNIPVIYLILSRVKHEFLSSNDQLMVYIFKTLQQYFNNKYVLVVDLSWTDIDDELQASLYRAVVSFVRLIKQEYLLNCQSIYILHPTFKTQSAIDDILNIMPPETKNKLVKTAYDWMDLSEVIESNKIWIPFVSKKFTPLIYHLIKINNVDKRQERYMKITNESILNIDSKACTVQNEIMLHKIEEIRSKAGSDIIIKFNSETDEEIKNRGAGYFTKEAKAQTGLQTRTYTCYTEQQKEIVIEAIFEAGVRAVSLAHKQTFEVEKEDKKKGKKLKRVIKLTTDSLLVFKDKVIKTEIPYSTIQSFFLSPSEKKDVLLIHFMLRGKKKQHVLTTPEAPAMRDALLDAVKRFKFGVQIEKDLFYKRDYDAALDRFFLASKSKQSKKEGDEEGWSTILRIDQPCNDLQKLLKKFKPGKDQKAEINPAKMKDVLAKLKLTLKDDEIDKIIRQLDSEDKGFIVLDDLVRSWVFMRRQRQMVEKRREALKRRQQQK